MAMKNYEKVRKKLANPRIRAILNCYLIEGKSELDFGKIYKKLSPHPRDPYSKEITGDPILKNKAQLSRDMTTLEQLGVVKWIEWGKYKLSNEFYKQLIKDEMLIDLESYSPEMVLFEGNTAFFGLFPDEIKDSFQKDYNDILTSLKDASDRLEELWIKIRLNDIGYSLEKTLSGSELSIDEKARLYKKVNDHVDFNLKTRRMYTDHYKEIFKPHIEQIKNPKVKDIERIIMKSNQIKDELDDLKDNNGKIIIREISIEMWQKRTESPISAFNNLIEDGKVQLSPEKISKVLSLLKESEKRSTEFRQSIFFLGFDAPMVVLNPKMNYHENDLFLVPFSQD